MNNAISRIFIVGVILFVALIVNLTWIMAGRAQWFADRPENKRGIAKEMKIKRGDILGYDGSTIAGALRRSGYYYRDYPQGTLAPQLVGYDSVRYGRSGIEQELNDELTGQSTDLGVQSWIDRLLGRKPKGASVQLTLVPAVQKEAQKALGGQKGAIVVLDPKTGALIASASAPTYDPANLEDDWARLSKDPGRRCSTGRRRVSTRRARPSRSSRPPPVSTTARSPPTPSSSTPAPTSCSAARSPTTGAPCSAPTISRPR